MLIVMLIYRGTPVPSNLSELLVRMVHCGKVTYDVHLVGESVLEIINY